MRSVLFGGHEPPRSRTFARWLVSAWGPVVIMLVAIAIESTHAFSSNNTSSWMRSVYEFIAGRVPDSAWAVIHHRIRKTGHFTGYGLLGLTFLRGWLLFWLQPLAGRVRAWWWTGTLLAVFCTMLVASVDELHQSFMPDRTGVVSDVLLDTAGAATMLLIFSVLAHMGGYAATAGDSARNPIDFWTDFKDTEVSV